jgi:hypothetical protein
MKHGRNRYVLDQTDVRYIEIRLDTGLTWLMHESYAALLM